MSTTVDSFADSRAASQRRERARDLLLLLLVAAGLAACFGLTRWLDARRAAQDPFASYEELYLKPETARRMSLAFNGLAADWYWLRSLQYVGRKMDAYQERFSLDDLSPLGVKRLAPLLEQATALDPQFMAAYEYGAVVLPSIDRDAAVRLVERGIRENPQDWWLYQHLGYIHWQAGRFDKAGEAYEAGARQPGAPRWMNVMAAQMRAQGGSREVARQMYLRMYEGANDDQVKELAVTRLAQIESLEERDRIRQALTAFRERAGRCPADWREVAPPLRNVRLRLTAAGAPLDPSDVPYVLDTVRCDVELGEDSKIPRK
jgi:tetratricopeptide (TPR) repeat protein